VTSIESHKGMQDFLLLVETDKCIYI
jgi:hypothetical protein